MGGDFFSNGINASEKISPYKRNDLSQLLTGFSLTNKFHSENGFILETGICYSNFTTSDFNVIAFNVSLNGPPVSISLPVAFEGLTIPVLIGKEHYFDNNVCSWSLFGGFSAGILMLTGFEDGTFDGLHQQSIDQDGSSFQHAFYLSANAVLEVHPFQRRLSGLGIGLLAGVQVNKTRFPDSYTIIVKSASGTESLPFVVDIHPRQAFNVSLVCSYTFFQQKTFKNKRLKKINPFSCPE